MSELNPFASPADRPAPERPVPVLSPPQTVKFQLLEEDLVESSLHTATTIPEVIATHQKQRRRQVFMGLMFFGVLGLFSLTDSPAVDFPQFLFGVAGCMFLLLAIFYPVFMRRNIKSRVKAWIKQGVVPLPDELVVCTIDENGVRYEKPQVQTLVAWPAISRVRNTKDHLFLYHQPSAPFIAPARSFVTEEGFQAFCNLAQRLWEEHHEPQRGLAEDL